MKAKQLAFLLLIGALSSCSPKAGERVGSTIEVQNKQIDWEGYDAASTVEKDGITMDQLQGEWLAYKGVYRFGEHVNEMKLDKPFMIEVKANSFRRNKNASFQEFQLAQNVLTQVKDSKTETGIINKLSKNELTITWKDEENYTRYYYQKSN